MSPRRHSRLKRWQKKKKLARYLQRWLHSMGFTMAVVKPRNKGNCTTRLPVDMTQVKAFWGTFGK